MPYKIIKNPGGTYRVVNSQTGSVKAARTTKTNAQRQVRLLQGVEHGMTPRKKK